MKMSLWYLLHLYFERNSYKHWIRNIRRLVENVSHSAKVNGFVPAHSRILKFKSGFMGRNFEFIFSIFYLRSNMWTQG